MNRTCFSSMYDTVRTSVVLFCSAAIDDRLQRPLAANMRRRHRKSKRELGFSSRKFQLLLFLTFSVLVANPKKLLYTVANPARGLLNREKRTKEKVWQHTPPPPPTPHTARSEKINKITRRIYRRYAGGRSRVRTRIPSARRTLTSAFFPPIVLSPKRYTTTKTSFSKYVVLRKI